MPRRARRHRFDLMADVNVVSLIDVMLLLLVIFMITAPMMQSGLDITLPTADAKPLETKDGLTITIDRNNIVAFGDEKYPLSQFRTVFPTVSKNRTRNGVYLSADRNVSYGTIAQVLSIINAAGVSNVGLMTQPEESR